MQWTRFNWIITLIAKFHWSVNYYEEKFIRSNNLRSAQTKLLYEDYNLNVYSFSFKLRNDFFVLIIKVVNLLGERFISLIVLIYNCEEISV